MPDLIVTNPFWTWLALTAIFLVVEVVIVPSGFFLCLGTSSAVVALFTFLFPETDWLNAFLLFSGIMLVSSLFWWRVMQKNRGRSNDDADKLGSRQQQLMGMRLVLDTPLHNGKGRVKLNDAAWPVEADEDYPAGTRVEVIEVSGITLRVKAV